MESDRAKLRLIRSGSRGQADGQPPDAAAPAIASSAWPPFRSEAVRLLSLDAHGRALDWMSWQDAACQYDRGAVAWTSPTTTPTGTWPSR